MKLPLISTIVLLSLFVSTYGAANGISQVLYRSEEKSPKVVLHLLKDPNDSLSKKTLRLEIPSKWPLIPSHKVEFQLHPQSDISSIENEIMAVLKEHHLFTDYGAKISGVLSGLHPLNEENVLCRQVHVEFVNPADESGLGDLLEKLSSDSGLFRQPSSFADSVLLTNLEIDGQELNLFVNFDEADKPVGITLGTERGDFVDYSLKKTENAFVLYDRDENLVLSLSNRQADVRKNILSFDLYIPTKGKSLVDVSNRRLNLYKVDQKWVTDAKVTKQEVDLAKISGLSVVINELSETDLSLLENSHRECLHLQAQNSLAQSQSGMRINCDRQIKLFATYLSLDDDAYLSEVFKSCLQNEDFITTHKLDDGHNYLQFASKISTVTDQVFLRTIQLCEKKTVENKELAQSLEAAEGKLSLAQFSFSKGDLILETQKNCSLNKYSIDQCQAALEKSLAYRALEATSKKQCEDILCFKKEIRTQLNNKEPVFPFHLLSTHASLDLKGLTHGAEKIRATCLENRIAEIDLEWELMTSIETLQRGCDEFALVEITRAILSEEVKKSLDSFISDQHLSRSILEQVRHVFDVNRSFDAMARSFSDLHQKAIEHAVVFYQAHELNRQFPTQGKNGEANGIAREQLTAKMAAELGLGSETTLEDLAYHGLSLRKTESAQQKSFPKNIYRDYLANFHLQMSLVKLAQTEGSRDEATVVESRQILTDCFKRIDRVADNGQYFNEQITDCENQNESMIFLSNFQLDLEDMVSERLPLTETMGNQILASVFDVRVCIQNRPAIFSDSDRHSRYMNGCALLGKTDVALNLVNQLFSHHGKILGDANKLPDQVAKTCIVESLKTFVEDSNQERLKSIFFSDRLELSSIEKTRPLIDFFFEQSQANPRSSIVPFYLGSTGGDSKYAASDKLRLGQFFGVISESRISMDEVYESIDTCLSEAQSAITASLRDRLIKTSPGVWGDIYRSENETYEEVLTGVVDHELIDLVLQLQRRHEQFRLNLFNDPRQEVLTRELTMETLADSIGVISHKLARGFVFDPQRMKTELIVFREELKEALKWVNSTDTTVRFGELGNFFKDSQLADHLALSEVSEQVFDRFNSFLQQMENDEIQAFNRKVGKPENRLSALEREERQFIFKKYSDLRILTREMTSSYDFRRIVHQGNQKGRDLLELIKTHSVLPQILGREVSPTARQEIDRKIAELILDDRSAGGFADRFVGVVAQRELDLRKDGHWSLTKALFYNESDFDWDKLRNHRSGQSALDFYSRQILLPQMLGRPVTKYEMGLRMAEFKRYVSQAVSEN